MKNILNRNVPELARWIRVFSTQKLGIYFFDKEILVWGLFSEGFLMPMLRHLIQSEVGMQGILLCRCLMEQPAKDTLTFFKHLAFEKRMELV